MKLPVTQTICLQSLPPTPVRSPFGHARGLEETDQWLAPKLRQVPVTRVYDATPLDSLGLPVWAAVTPLALDLTVHAGKGQTPTASRISAVMESIERISAESIAENRLCRRPFGDWPKSAPRPLDPRLFDLPFETGYDPVRPILWVAGYDLLQDHVTFVAADLVISPPREKVCLGVETNGLAAGNVPLEAILHALYELIERDAASHDQFCELMTEAADPFTSPVRVLRLDSLPPRVRRETGRLERRGLSVRVQELAGAVDVPVYQTTIIDQNFPASPGNAMRFAGYGCDLDRERALLRSLTEAVQSHTVVLLGARDHFEGTLPAPDRGPRLSRVLDLRYPRSWIHYSPQEPGSSGELLEDLKIVLKRLRKAGMQHCVVVDLTRPDLQVPVVRVLVPGLAHPYGYTTRRPPLRLLLNLV